MTTLALDTTTEFGSLALISGDAVAAELLIHSKDGFGHILYDHLRTLLERSGCRLDDIDCFAAAAGPGSFTGVRVGLAAIKGLAAALGKPVVAVSNLQAIASFGAAPLRAAVLDARRGEIYGAVYNSDLEPVSSEVVTQFSGWLGTLPAGELEFVATDFAPFRDALIDTRFANAPVTEAPRALAAAIGRIASRLAEAGRASDPAAIDANYVRRSDAELLWRDR